MDKKIAMKWARALESGKYHQTKNKLFNGKGYCCLGVLCKITGFKFQKDEEGNYQCEGGEIEDLPFEVQDLTGFQSCLGDYEEGEGSNNLARLNDEGKKFKTIAKVIREKWEEL